MTDVEHIRAEIIEAMAKAMWEVEPAHADLIATGDTMRDHLLRLGALGAQRDTEARARLAALMAPET